MMLTSVISLSRVGARLRHEEFKQVRFQEKFGKEYWWQNPTVPWLIRIWSYCAHNQIFILYSSWMFLCRHTLVSSVSSSIPTRTCPSTRRRLLTCIKARRGMKCHLTSTLSLIRPTEAWCRVRKCFLSGQFYLSSCILHETIKLKKREISWVNSDFP